MPNVLVTAGYSRVAYTICRTLAQNGYTVYVGAPEKYCIAGASRYCSGKLLYTHQDKNEEQFLDDILSFIDEKKIDILVPVLSESFIFEKHIEKFASKVRYFLPDYEKVQAAHNKKRISEIAQTLDIAVPETWDVADLLQDEAQLATLPYPVIIKLKEGGGGWDTYTFFNAESLLRHLKGLDISSRYMLQRFIEGKLVGACGIYRDGAFLGGDVYAFTKTFPIKVGQATIRETIRDDKALSALKKILDHLEWNGVCEMDFIIEDSSGTPYLLDVNPRFWGSLIQNITAGMNYPLYYCQLALGETNVVPGEAKIGTQTRWLGGDIMRILAELRIADNKFATLKQLLSDKNTYVAHDDWDKRDPIPFISWISWIALRRLKRLSQKLLRRQPAPSGEQF